jgi:hypothetical protein
VIGEKCEQRQFLPAQDVGQRGHQKCSSPPCMRTICRKRGSQQSFTLVVAGMVGRTHRVAYTHLPSEKDTAKRMLIYSHKMA